MVLRWEQLMLELKTHAPTLLAILQSGCSRLDRKNVDGVIGMCCAMILKMHYCRMSLVQKIVSVILVMGHSSQQDY